MSKEIVKNESVPKYMQEFKDNDLGMSSKEIEFPLIKLLQPMSDMAVDGTGRPGDVVDNNGIKLTGKNDTLTIVPFFRKKAWTVLKVNTTGLDDFEGINYITTEEEEKLPENYVEDGTKYRRMFTLQIYALLNDEKVPYLFTLRSTGLQFARRLITEMYLKNKMAGIPAYGKSFLVDTKLRKSSGKQWYNFNLVKTIGFTPEKRCEEAQKWLNTLS